MVMISLTASDVSACSTPSALQLAEVVLRIQPSVGTALRAVMGVSQLPSFPTAAGTQLDVDHLLDHVFAYHFYILCWVLREHPKFTYRQQNLTDEFVRCSLVVVIRKYRQHLRFR